MVATSALSRSSSCVAIPVMAQTPRPRTASSTAATIPVTHRARRTSRTFCDACTPTATEPPSLVGAHATRNIVSSSPAVPTVGAEGARGHRRATTLGILLDAARMMPSAPATVTNLPGPVSVSVPTSCTTAARRSLATSTRLASVAASSWSMASSVPSVTCSTNSTVAVAATATAQTASRRKAAVRRTRRLRQYLTSGAPRRSRQRRGWCATVEDYPPARACVGAGSDSRRPDWTCPRSSPPSSSRAAWRA